MIHGVVLVLARLQEVVGEPGVDRLVVVQRPVPQGEEPQEERREEERPPELPLPPGDGARARVGNRRRGHGAASRNSVPRDWNATLNDSRSGKASGPNSFRSSGPVTTYRIPRRARISRTAARSVEV